MEGELTFCGGGGGGGGGDKNLVVGSLLGGGGDDQIFGWWGGLPPSLPNRENPHPQCLVDQTLVQKPIIVVATDQMSDHT